MNSNSSSSQPAPAATATPAKVAVPRQLADADRVWQQGRGRDFLLSSLKWLLLLLAGLAAADLILQLESVPRLALGLGFAAVVVAVFVRFFHLAFLSNYPLERIARILESRDASLGSRLINLIQLKDEAENPDHSPATRQLAARAIEDAADKNDSEKLQAAASKSVTRRQIAGALIPVGLTAALCLGFLPIAGTVILRYLDPFGDHPPYSFTRLAIREPAADGHEVVYHDPLLVEVGFEGHQPDEVLLSAWSPDSPDEVITVPMIGKGELGFAQQLDHVDSDLILAAHTRGGRSRSPQRRVTVQLTPRFRETELILHPPAYTGLPSSSRPWEGKAIRVLSGTELEFRFRSNRPLQGGTAVFTPTSVEGGRQEIDLQAGSSDEDLDLATLRLPAEASGKLEISLTDVDGRPSRETLEGPITVTYDLAPKVEIAKPSADSFIVEGHRLEAEIVATDDYGLKTLRLHRALNEIFSAPLELPVKKRSRRERRTVVFDLAELGVRPGDMISFFAEAIDIAPEPHLSRSKVRHLLVISEEEYNESLRTKAKISDLQNRYNDLLDDYRELVERQQELTEAMEQLQQELVDAQSEAEKQALNEKLQKLLEQQEAINEQLMEQAQAMEDFVRDEPLYDVEKSLQEMLQARAEEIRESVAQNREATESQRQQATDSPPTPGGSQQAPSPESLQQLAEAARQHRDNLAGSQEGAEEEISQPIEDLAKLHEIVNDFNHFKQLYEAQQAIARQAAAYDTGRELTDEDRLSMQNLAAQERELGEQLEQLSEKLREDATAAEENFPQAAQSARDLADQIQSAGMPRLAGQCATQMLGANASGSRQSAERLRDEMAKLFGEAEQQQGQMAGELDR